MVLAEVVVGGSGAVVEEDDLIQKDDEVFSPLLEAVGNGCEVYCLSHVASAVPLPQPCPC